MSILFVMIPVALFLAAFAIAGFIWAAREGQFDDTDTPPHRVLFDDEPVAINHERENETTKNTKDSKKETTDFTDSTEG